jgi:hypothetical protein
MFCVSFVGMTLQFGHAYTDPRTLPTPGPTADSERRFGRAGRAAIESIAAEITVARERAAGTKDEYDAFGRNVAVRQVAPLGKQVSAL